MQNGSSRTSFSLVLSTILHGSVITMVALGPAFLPGLQDKVDRSGSETVEFTVATPELTNENLSDMKSVVVAEAPSPVTAPVAPAAAAPVVKKAAAKKAIAKAQTLPTKAETVEAQPAIAAEDVVIEQPNTEQVEIVKPIEEIAPTESIAKEENFKPIEDEAPAIDVAEEQVVAQETAPVAKEEVAPAPVVAEKVEAAQAPAQSTPPAESAQPAPAPTAATTAAATTTTGAQDAKPEVIEVTQSYQGLQQMQGNKPPTYSREMRLQKMQGRGQLVYYVTRDGRIDQLRLTKSTGSPALDKAAIDSFSKYKFVPGQEGYTVHDFEFSLKGPSVSDAGRLRTTLNKSK